jgi:hypothetical protein
VNENIVSMISTGIKLALEMIAIANQLEKEGIKVPELDEVRKRLKELQNSPLLPES